MFRCIAYNEKNERKVLKLNMNNEDEVLHYAKLNNLKIIDIKKTRQLFRRKQLKNKDLKIFSKEIHILLKSGCEISKILQILIEESNTRVKSIVKDILINIQKGNSIKESFEITNAFSSFYINMVQTGEMSGNLDTVMDKLSIYYDKEQKLQNKIISVLIYPIILIFTMIISFSFILIFIIPKFEEIYMDNTVKTPILTKILMFLSHLIRNNFLLIIIINVMIILGFMYFRRNNKKFNEYFNKISFKTPIIKNYKQLIIANKFIKSLSILISSGVQIVQSIEIAGQAIGNEYIYMKICNANELIKKGNSIGDSLKVIDELPSLLVSMISIGEESGMLDKILDTISEYYENELDCKLEIGMKYFENIITLVIGVIVGITVISMMIPMFDVVSSI